MNKNKTNKKLITSLSIDNIDAIGIDESNSNMYSFVIPVVVDKSLASLVKSINLVSITSESFKNTFPNQYLSNTNFSSYTKQRDDDLTVKLSNSLTKNIFYNYQTKASNSDSININFEFQNEERMWDNNLYSLYIPIDFSNNLISNSCNNLRIFFLDENENILDETGIINIDFANIKQRKMRYDKDFFISTFFYNIKISFGITIR